MSPMLEETTELNPQAFILTSKTLEKFERLRLSDPASFEQALQLLTNAQNALFVPFLTKTPPQFVEFEFERFAYQFFSYRVSALALLLRAFGSSDFGARYVAALSKLSKTLSEKAPKWGLDPREIEETFSRYLTGAIRMFGITSIGIEPDDNLKVVEVLKAITKVDFGLTAIVLIFEESIVPEKWVLSKTLSLTSKSLDEYNQAVSSLFQNKKHADTIAGSLSMEGDLDQALEKFNFALLSLFRR